MNWNIFAAPNEYSVYTGCLELLGHLEADTAEEAISKGQERWGNIVYRVHSIYEVRYVDKFIEGYTRSTLPSIV